LHGGCSYGQARVRWFRLYCGRCSRDLEQACVRRFSLRVCYGRAWERYLHVDGNLLLLRLYMYLWHSKR